MKKKIGQNAPKISIIVPVYNMQAYLEKCLNSIITQTLLEIEIICVNDGSTDDSLAILQDFAHRDKRVTIINKPNEGVSSARNAGLKNASGKYVMFVDGDDWIEPETCAECYARICQDQSDMVVFNFKSIYPDGKTTISDKLNKLREDQSFLFNECPNDFFYIMTSVWGKLFKLRKEVTFATNLKKGEDAVYFWEYCLKYNPKINILKKIFYNYFRRLDGAFCSEEFIKECNIVKSIKTLASKNCFKKASEWQQSHILDRFAQSLCYEINHATITLGSDYFTQIKNVVTMFNDYSDADNLYHYKRLHDLSLIYNRKIDLVYLWVNGNDVEWQKQKKYWAEKCRLEINNADNQTCRFIDNQELRYSLRSVQTYAPWINQIYIVTNGQVPEWLDTSHPKIKIITHEQIMPQDAVPTFNSEAIESCLANIPNLSEYFLYANDDYFIGQSIKPDYFFDENGTPKLYVAKQNWTEEQIQKMHFRNTITTSINLVNERFGEDFSHFSINHNIVPLRKSMFLACAKEFESEFNRTAHCRFRTPNTVERIIVELYSIIMLKLKPITVNIHEKNSLTPLAYIDLKETNDVLHRLYTNKPKLFCINDNEKTLDANRKKLKYLLAALFPIRQAWEKDYGVSGSLLNNNFMNCNEKKSKFASNTRTADIQTWRVNKTIFSFCGLPLFKIRKDPISYRMYLFKFIPIYKITYRKQKTVFKLFNFLPLCKIKKYL